MPAVVLVGDELLERLDHGALELDAVGLGHGARERERGQVAPDTHAHRRLPEAELGQVEEAAGRQAGRDLRGVLVVPVGHVVHLAVDLVVGLGRRRGEGGREGGRERGAADGKDSRKKFGRTLITALKKGKNLSYSVGFMA